MRRRAIVQLVPAHQDFIVTSRPHPIVGVVLFAPVTALTAVLVVAVAAGIQAGTSEVVPVSALSALGLVAALPLLERAGRNAVGDRASLAASLAVLGATPLLVAGATYGLDQPILGPEIYDHAALAVVFLGPPVLFAWMIVSAVAAVVLAMPRLGGIMERGLRGLRMAAVLGAATVFCVAAVRAARYPEPDRWVRRLPIVLGGEGRAELDGETVTQRCGSRCDIGLSSPFAQQKGFKWQVRRKGAIAVRYDARHQLWVLDDDPPVAFNSWGSRVGGFAGDPSAPGGLGGSFENLAGETSPPLTWIAALGVGLAIAALAMRRRRRASRLLTALRSAREGTLGADGWISFGDERLLAPVGLIPGPVLVLDDGSEGEADPNEGAHDSRSSPASSSSPDRAGRAEVVVLPGVREDHLASVRLSMTCLDARVVAAVALTAAPVVAAWVRGLRWC